jgi:large repetitive protein
MANIPQPFDSTYFDSPYFNPEEAANVAADPTTPGQYDFSDLQIVPATLANATVGFPYTGNITLTGGFEPYDSLSIFDGNANIAAANLVFNVDPVNRANANISGISNAAQTVTFTVQGTETFGNLPAVVTSQLYNLNVVVPNITVGPGSLSNASVGTFYTQTFTSTNGSGSITYSNIGALPAGLSLVSATGNLSGIPTSPATPINFTIRATDAYNSIGNTTYSLNVITPNIVISPSSLSNAVVGNYYTQIFTSTNGVGAITYSNIGNIPSGLSLVSATGNLSGIVNSNVTPINFTIRATDAYNTTGNIAYSLNVNQPVVTINPATAANGVVGVAYVQQLTATGGITPYFYSVTGGVLPANVALNATTGNITGTPTVATTSTYTVTAYDFYQSPGSRTYTPTIILPTITITPTTLSNATTGQYYQKNIIASGGTPPYTYAVTANTLPTSLSLSSGGVLDGIVNAPGTTVFTITATDSYNSTGNIVYSLTSDPITLVVGPATIPDGTCGLPYSVQFFTSAGITPYVFSVTAGTLPTGLTLNPLNGLLSGVCLDDGPYSFTVTATDAFLNTGSNSYTTTFVADILPQSLPNPVERIPYTQILSAVGGVAPYTFAVTTGALPTGLSLVDNLITGTPTTPGPYSFVISATDAVATVITQSYSFTVIPQPPIAISPTNPLLPKATVDVAYNEIFEAIGGNRPYTYTITGGALPAGLILNPTTGVLSGTVTQGGLFDFFVTATDAAGFSIRQPYSLPVLVFPDIPDEAIRVYVGGALQTSGYTVTSKSPATVAFDTPPPEGVAVTIAVLQGYSWYRNGLLTASDGIALQEQTTPDAIFLQGN